MSQIFHAIHSFFSPQRTERLPKDRNLAETDPPRFAALIIEKLEKLLQDHERNRLIEESLNRVIYDEVCCRKFFLLFLFYLILSTRITSYSNL